jgi:hypothetical protein
MNLSRLNRYDDSVITTADASTIEDASNEPGGISLECLIAKSRLQDLLAKQKKSHASV